MNIQQVLRELRAYGLTQSQIAQMVGISQASISRWESGDAPDTADVALKMRDILADFRSKQVAA